VAGKALLHGDPVAWLLERGARDIQSHLWHQLSFPLFYRADVLFGSRALDAAGKIDDPRAQPYADRMPSRVDTTKWVTLQVATILKHVFGEAAA
jgi:hypothetical protein